MYSTLMLRGRFVCPIRKPVVPLVRNYTISFRIVIASVAQRCLGYVEVVVVEKTDLRRFTPSIDHFKDPDQSVLVRQNQISSLYLNSIRVRKTRLENRTVRKKSLFPYPRIVRQPAENIVTVSTGQNPRKGPANVLRIIVAWPEEMPQLSVLPNSDQGRTVSHWSLLTSRQHFQTALTMKRRVGNHKWVGYLSADQ